MLSKTRKYNADDNTEEYHLILHSYEYIIHLEMIKQNSFDDITEENITENYIYRHNKKHINKPKDPVKWTVTKVMISAAEDVKNEPPKNNHVETYKTKTTRE